MRTWFKVVLGLVLLLAGGLGYLYWRSLPRIPARPFEKPAGVYPVGTREFVWTDTTRPERYTKSPNDWRRLVVQAWYPAAPGGVDTARYLLRPDEFADRRGAKAGARALTNSVLDAPLATAEAPFPVLVYNHGGFWTRWSATFATEWLASHGYVVVSVEHFGFNQTTRFPDGTAFAADTLAMPKETGDGKQDALASWAYLGDPVFKIWEDDARFVLDQLELQQAEGPFQGRLDLDKIGMFGWSFGGALSVQMTMLDPRVKAAVNHDGQLFGEVRERGTTRPVLLLHHGNDDALDYQEKERSTVYELLALVTSWDSTARERSTADWHEATIARTDHGHFSDLSLFYPQKKTSLDGKRGHEIIRAYTLDFFDHYLLGKPLMLIGSGSARFAGVTERSWRRAPVGQ